MVFFGKEDGRDSLRGMAMNAQPRREKENYMNQNHLANTAKKSGETTVRQRISSLLLTLVMLFSYVSPYLPAPASAEEMAEIAVDDLVTEPEYIPDYADDLDYDYVPDYGSDPDYGYDQNAGYEQHSAASVFLADVRLSIGKSYSGSITDGGVFRAELPVDQKQTVILTVTGMDVLADVEKHSATLLKKGNWWPALSRCRERITSPWPRFTTGRPALSPCAQTMNKPMALC